MDRVLDEVAKMECLREMMQMEGWQLVENFINERMADCRRRLETCNLEDVPKLRERIETYKSILRYIEDTIEEGIMAMPP